MAPPGAGRLTAGLLCAPEVASQLLALLSAISGGSGAGGLRPQEVHAGHGLKVGLHTPTILGENSYLGWFYDRGAIKGQSQNINRGPIRKLLPNYAHIYVTIQSFEHRAGTHCTVANEVRN